MAAPVCIIGTGYVGMACVIGLAELGFEVNGYDIQFDRIERLNAGITPYRESGLEELLRKHLAGGRVNFFNTLDGATRDSEIIVIAVGTPSRDDGSADLSALELVVSELSTLHFLNRPTIVVRSTVPPGTCDRLAMRIEGFGDTLYAPEFLREGSAVGDFLNPDRIVIGCANPMLAIRYARLFEALHKPVVFTTRKNAELIKCFSNAFLALKISFANEVANICDAVGAGADDVLRGIGYDRRIGGDFLNPGIGFGGPCFEKDVKSMDHISSQLNTGSQLFSAILRVNEFQQQRIVSIVEDEVGDLAGKEIGVWGLAFKAGTDDLRDSLALRIIGELGLRGASVVAYDPAVRVAPLPSNCRMATSPLEAAKCDALLVLTEWPEFAKIHPADYAPHIRMSVIIDGRNVLDAERVQGAGLRYRGVGRSENVFGSETSIVVAR